MTLFYLGYWSAEDSLTTATIVPHLQILSAFDAVERIVFCSIERNGDVSSLSIPKVEHIPLFSKNRGSVFLTKVSDYFLLYDGLKKIFTKNKFDFIICRSSLAGAFGHRLSKRFRVPYLVESFEPHARYMVDSDVWKWFDPRTIIQSAQEALQKRSARYLLPVSHNYAAKLHSEGIQKQRVHILPCCIDTGEFKYSEEKRTVIRETAGIPVNAIVGIYVGKFGGIYYREQAFALYKEAFDFFGDRFWLIILSGQDHNEIIDLLKEYNVPMERVVLRSVPHKKVNEYLSASDFAFSTIKPAPSRIYCSPVKNGEYWANGLPVIVEPGIGDDSDIIGAEGGGVLLKNDNPADAFRKVQKLLIKSRSDLAAEIQAIAIRHRGFHIIKQVYEKLFF